MRIPFRQGIVSCQTSAGQPDFLLISGEQVLMKTDDAAIIVAFVSGSNDYLYQEPIDSNPQLGWIGPFTVNVDYWLYWDIDKITGLRTFGATTSQLIYDYQTPSNPVVNQHWFDSNQRLMKVWTGTNWVSVIRVFACKFSQGATIEYIYPIGQSQVALDEDVNAGYILFDANNKPVKNSDKGFFTLSDRFFTAEAAVNGQTLENAVFQFNVAETITPFKVVKIIAENTVALADYEDTPIFAVGLSLNHAEVGEIVNVCMEGVITNIDWHWTNISGFLWIDHFGTLVEIDPHVTLSLRGPFVPVGRIIAHDKIFFFQGMMLGYISTGSSGFSGISGFSGSVAMGFSGWSGVSGFSGTAGTSGFSGTLGTSGFSGWSGTVGSIGVSGFSGFSGWSGISGFSGWSGYSGPAGPAGSSGSINVKVCLTGSGTFEGPDIGSQVLVTMIGGGGAGHTGNNDVNAGGGGGSGEFLFEAPLTYTGPITYSVGAGGTAGSGDGGNSVFDVLTALGGKGGNEGFPPGSGGVGGNNSVPNDGASNELVAAGDWSGANGGGASSTVAADPAQQGGDSIVDYEGNAVVVPGGLGGTMLSPRVFQEAAGGGGAASPYGSGGKGGDSDEFNDLSWNGESPAAGNYGAGGGGGGETGNSFGLGAAGAPGRICVEYTRNLPITGGPGSTVAFTDVQQVFTKAQSSLMTVLSTAVDVAPAASGGNNFVYILLGDINLLLPTGFYNGTIINLVFLQDNVGNHAVAWPAEFIWSADFLVPPEVSSAANSRTLVSAIFVESINKWLCSIVNYS